ncbi:MAG: hypothetical protein R3A47_10480 [Polyangiales bacterium]
MTSVDTQLILDASRFPLIEVTVPARVGVRDIDDGFHLLEQWVSAGSIALLIDFRAVALQHATADLRSYFYRGKNAFDRGAGKDRVVVEALVMSSLFERVLFQSYLWMKTARTYESRAFRTIETARTYCTRTVETIVAV